MTGVRFGSLTCSFVTSWRQELEQEVNSESREWLLDGGSMPADVAAAAGWDKREVLLGKESAVAEQAAKVRLALVNFARCMGTVACLQACSRVLGSAEEAEAVCCMCRCMVWARGWCMLRTPSRVRMQSCAADVASVAAAHQGPVLAILGSRFCRGGACMLAPELG
jgi:hypothetical protein